MKRLEDAVGTESSVREAGSAASTSTGTGKRFVRSDRSAAQSDALGLASLPDPVRLAMSAIAHQAGSPEAALEPVIGLLVGDDPAKCAAIVNAFQTNEPLREQWLRTYEILRG
jgi:hypothetical protein